MGHNGLIFDLDTTCVIPKGEDYVESYSKHCNYTVILAEKCKIV